MPDQDEEGTEAFRIPPPYPPPPPPPPPPRDLGIPVGTPVPRWDLPPREQMAGGPVTSPGEAPTQQVPQPSYDPTAAFTPHVTPVGGVPLYPSPSQAIPSYFEPSTLVPGMQSMPSPTGPRHVVPRRRQRRVPRWFIAGVVCLLCILVGVGIGSSGERSILKSSPTPTATRTVTHTVTHTKTVTKKVYRGANAYAPLDPVWSCWQAYIRAGGSNAGSSTYCQDIAPAGG